MKRVTKDETTELASKHLGTGGDYSQYMRTEPDPSLLVGIPRKLNRDLIVGRDSDEFFKAMGGYDIWRGYEISCLNNKGYPINFIAAIVIPADSINLIESKSMKLYWNSFNMWKAGSSYQEVKSNVETRALCAIANVCGLPTNAVTVELYSPESIKFTNPVPESNALIKAFEDYSPQFREMDYTVKASHLDNDSCNSIVSIWFSGLRSNCRVTKQPDFADIHISLHKFYSSQIKLPSELSLAKYVCSFRNSYHFHEEIIEQIYATLASRYEVNVMVKGLYTRRGGWDINPVRGSHMNSYTLTGEIFDKTNRQ